MVKWDCFVGNVEYTVGDEQLRQIFSEVGRVKDMRMKLDDQGRPSGYGFIEFDDADTVRAAIALLDQRHVGNRPMKVNHSNNSGMAQEAPPIRVPDDQRQAIPRAIQHHFTMPEAAQIIAELKQMAEAQPHEVQAMLRSYPNLAVAVLHMQMMLGMHPPVESLQQLPTVQEKGFTQQQQHHLAKQQHQGGQLGPPQFQPQQQQQQKQPQPQQQKHRSGFVDRRERFAAGHAAGK